MSKNDAHTKVVYMDEVVPSFLSTEHLIREQQEKASNVIDIVETDPFAQKPNVINDFVIRESLHQALEEQRIDLFMQPVVTLPQRQVRFFELYGRLRIKPGQYLPAGEYLSVANEEHIVNKLDRLFLANFLSVLKKQYGRYDQPVAYFLNIQPHTLRDQNFMGQLLHMIERHKELAQLIILEMRHNDFFTLSPGEAKILDGLARLGCRFSMDHIEHIPTNVRYMRQRNIRFIKVNADMLIRDGKTEIGFSEILSKKHNLDVNGITMIVEKTEKEDQLLEILDFDIPYGQGFLFGRPDFQGVYTPEVRA